MDRLQITFINVGYGEAIYIRCPDAALPGGWFTMLIDGGSAEAEEYAPQTTGRIRAAEYLRQEGAPRLNVMVNTHIHEDHLCGLLPVAQALRPQEFWQSFDEGFALGEPGKSVREAKIESTRKFLTALRDYDALRRVLAEQGGRVRQLRAGEERTVCRDLRVEVLGPQPEDLAAMAALLQESWRTQDGQTGQALLAKADAAMNNYSMILLLDYCGTKILLPGDTNRDGYGRLAGRLRADIFKVGHHGQSDGISQALLEDIRPRHVVCCASSDRRYGSAAPEILALAREAGAQLHFSDCPIADIPPHQALVFSIGRDGDIQADYRAAGTVGRATEI